MRKTLSLASVMAIGAIMLTGCNNMDAIREKAEKELAANHYNEALHTLLEVPDRGLLRDDTLMWMVSEASYGSINTPKALVGTRVEDMDFTPDMKKVLFTDMNQHKVSIFSYPDMKPLKSIEMQSYPYSIDISPDGTEFAAAMSNNDIEIYNIETGEQTRKLKGHTNQVRAVAYQDKDHLFSGANDQNVMIWDIPSQTVLDRQWLHSKNVKNVRRSKDGKYIVTASNDGSATVIHSSGEQRGKTIQKVNHGQNYVNDAILSPDSKVLATAYGEGEVRLWDVRTGNEIKSITVHDPIMSLDYSADGKMIVAGGRNNVYFIDADKGVVAGVFPVSSNVWSVRFLPDGKVAFADAFHFRILQILTGEELIDAARKLEKTFSWQK